MTAANPLVSSQRPHSPDLSRELLRHTLPVLATNMVGLTVGLLELKIAGLLGPITLAAVATAFVWVSMAQSFSLAALSIGATRTTALLKNDPAGVRTAFSAIILGAAAIGCIFLLAVVAVGEALLSTAGLQGEALAIGTTFLAATAVSFPPLFLLGGLQGFLRGMGRPTAGSVIVNGALISGLVLAVTFAHPSGLGLGHLGLAAATVVSCWAGALVGLAYLRGNPIVPSGVTWNLAANFRWTVLADVLRIAYPAALVWIIVAVTAFYSQSIIAQFGPDYLGGFGLVVRLETVIGVVASAFSAGLVYCASELIRTDRVGEFVALKQRQQGLLLVAVFPSVAVCLAAPTLWPRLFTDDAGIIGAAAHNGRYFACGLVFMGLAQVASSGLIALGLPLRMVAVIFVKNVALTLPLMYAAGWAPPGMLPDSVFVAQVLSAPAAWLLAEWLLRGALARILTPVRTGSAARGGAPPRPPIGG